MSNVLILVEHQDGKPKKASQSGITFGKQMSEKMGGQLNLLVIGQNVQAVADALSGYGAAKIFTVEGSAFEHALAESYTAAIVTAAKACGATLIAGTSSSTSKDVMPRVAARLDAGMASDVLKIVDAKTFKRPMWAGNVIATVELTSEIKVCTVRATEFEQPVKQGGASPVEKLACDVSLANLKAKFISLKTVKSERPDVTTASRVVSGGRGVKGADGFKMIEELADVLGAGIGASRAVCDAGWVPNDLQIGQTGKVVAPDLYIAVGISGAIQHIAGMKSSKVIVAINKDPEAPIFQVADYGLVGDLFKIVPEFIAEYKKIAH
jgi:electron transfer flavoprotein alpha subunit